MLGNGEPASIATLTDGDLLEASGTLLMYRETGDSTDRDLATSAPRRSRFARSTPSSSTKSISWTRSPRRKPPF
jgi:hypothetical protein